MKDYTQIEHINKYIEERMKQCYDAGYEQGRKDEKEMHEGCDDVIRAFAEGILIGSMEVSKENVPQFPSSDKCCCEKGEKISSQDKRVKIVTDIDEDAYTNIKRGKIDSSMCDVPLESILAIANGTPLSKNITNGEVLSILFPNMRYHFTLTDKSVMVVATIGGFKSSFDLDWWNTPYKAESEKKEVNNT